MYISTGSAKNNIGSLHEASPARAINYQLIARLTANNTTGNHRFTDRTPTMRTALTQNSPFRATPTMFIVNNSNKKI